jgi:TPR repeat protein
MAMLAGRYKDGVGVEQSYKKMTELYEMAAKRGDATAQFNLGVDYEKGSHGVTQSDKRAIEFYTLSAEQGFAKAQFNLGCMYANGKGVTRSYSKAREWWKKAAAKGVEDAIIYLKRMDEEEGVESTTTTPEVVDPNTITCSTCGKPQTNAFKLKKCACYTTWYCNTACQKKQRKQHKKECVRLVKERNKNKNEQHLKGDGTKDGKKEPPIQEEEDKEDKEDCPICTDALPRLSGKFVRLSCCGKGLHKKCSDDLDATECMTLEQKNMCILCRTKRCALGSNEDIERLRGWTKKGKGWAMCILAQRYENGIGVKQSDKKAIELTEMAAKRGHADAQFNLGNFYREGSHGLTQSSERAIEFYTLAANQGDTDAQHKLGIMYENGKGVTQSYEKARKWHTLAADLGDARSQVNLGVFFEQGLGGEQSYIKMKKYWELAAAQGNADAQRNLGLMWDRSEWGVERSAEKARECWSQAAAQGHEEAIKNLHDLDIFEEKSVTIDKKEEKETPPEVVDPNTITCSTCGKLQTNEFKLGKCQCRTKRYCNRQCQLKQRKQHKKECVRLVKERKKKKNEQNMKKDGTKDGNTETAKLIQETEDKEDCPICTDALPKISIQFVRLSCCGKGLHIKCYKDLMENTSMTLEQKNTCIMCRAQLVREGSKEEIERLHGWVAKEQGWAIETLAERYRDGVGVKQSDKKMFELFEMAATRGNANAQHILGLYYNEGSHGLTQSSERASEFYTLAAEQGHVNAQFNLGLMYANREGIQESFSKAREWFTKAAAQGHEKAVAAIKQMDAKGM